VKLHTGSAASRMTLLGVLLSVNLAAHSEVPAGRPVIPAGHLTTLPVLDGKVIGDSAWDGLSPASGFWQVQPDDGVRATQATEVYIGFSGDALYIGVIAYDDNPEGILVTDSRRDSDLGDTDSFQVLIDGMRDGQNGFVFGTNPAGIEYDGQVTREGEGGEVSCRNNGATSWPLRMGHQIHAQQDP
jgi:hypothetical protein